ncbi:MAG: addiction module protein [Spirochaetales bacterium]|nr:addiction module protein [Spirochaetales bacterium]
MTVQEIRAAALTLDAADRVELADALYASLPVDLEIQKEWAEEAQRRWEDYKAGKSIPVPADQAILRARERVYEYQNRLRSHAGAGRGS